MTNSGKQVTEVTGTQQLAISKTRSQESEIRRGSETQTTALMQAFIIILSLIIVLWYSEKTSANMTGHNSEDSSVAIEDFSGELGVGHIYKATWPIDDMVLAHLPFHHAYHIEWKKTADFPNLNPGSQFIFKVLSWEIWKAGDEYRWNDMYICEIFSAGQ